MKEWIKAIQANQNSLLYLTELLEQAWITSSVHHHETKIRSGALFEVFIASEQIISSKLLNVLSPIKQEELKTEFYNIVKGSVEDSSVSF